MNLSRFQPVSRRICSAVFLAVIFVFFLRYGLIRFGWIENQVSVKAKSAPQEQLTPPPARNMGKPVSSVAVVFERGRMALKRFEVAVRSSTAEADDYARRNALWRIPFSELNMSFRKAAGMRLFPDADQTLRLDNGHLIQVRDRLDVAFAACQVGNFWNSCADRDLPFLFVVLPTKAARNNPQLPWGMEDHCIDNLDRFMAQIAAEGVPVLDLQSQAEACFTNYFDLFFRTDHHWKPETGLWAAAQIAEELNRQYGFLIPAEMLAPSNFQVQVYPRFFLGSLGKKVTRAYAPPDDFSLITPRFDTSMTGALPRKETVRNGDFRSVWIDERQIERQNYYFRNPYGAYAFGDPPLMSVVNHRQPDGKRLLVIKDSYANVVTPFLSLVCANIDMLDLRYFNGSVAAHMDRFKPDAVLVLYSAGFIRHATAETGDGNPFHFD